MKAFDDALENAFRSSTPDLAIRVLAQELIASGHKREEVLGMFEKARERLGREGREKDEETVLGIMDFLVGWCGPHMKI